MNISEEDLEEIYDIVLRAQSRAGPHMFWRTDNKRLFREWIEWVINNPGEWREKIIKHDCSAWAMGIGLGVSILYNKWRGQEDDSLIRSIMLAQLMEEKEKKDGKHDETDQDQTPRSD